MDKKSVDRWTDDEVQALLGVFAEEDIQQQLAAATRNDKVYAKISARLGELNIHRSSKQVREKLKKLKQDYRRIKNHNNRNGSDRRSGKWFDRLDAVLGQRLFYSDTADTKDAVLLEPIRDETETEESNEAEEDREEVAELSAAPMAKRPCQCCCQTYSEILSFLEKRSEAEQRLREDEFALRREEIEIQRSKIALERERLADERKERERRFELESQERQVILGLLKEKVLKG